MPPTPANKRTVVDDRIELARRLICIAVARDVSSNVEGPFRISKVGRQHGLHRADAIRDATLQQRDGGGNVALTGW